MQDRVAVVASRMMAYNRADTRRIGHALKVFGLVKALAEQEGLDAETRELLETTALLHDIGIKLSEQKYGVSSGHYQQIEGPPVARKLLEGLGFSAEAVERICYLIAHHHTYTGVDGIDYQILIEADFIVNIEEKDIAQDQIASIRTKYFKTKGGKELIDSMFPMVAPTDGEQSYYHT